MQLLSSKPKIFLYFFKNNLLFFKRELSKFKKRKKGKKINNNDNINTL